jgi:hypothetical protein
MIVAWILLLTIISLAFLIPAIGFKDNNEDDVYRDRSGDGDNLTFT